MTMLDGGVLTMPEVMIWYMVLWSAGLDGSWTRPAPQHWTSVGLCKHVIALAESKTKEGKEG